MTARRFLPLIVFAIVALAAGPGAAQSRMDKATAAAAEAAEPAASRPESEQSGGAIAMPSAPDAVVLADAATRQRYLQAMQRYYEYRADGYAYRSRVFEWQLLSSRLIFIVVLTLVGAGMYFAAVQFRMAMRASGTPALAGAAVAEPAIPMGTQLEFSTKGVVVNSSVMGVIILSLSLAFFYLYLVYVYPIENVF
jgi:hypothetical protein